MSKPMFPDQFDWHGCDAVQFDPEMLSGRGNVGGTRMFADGVYLNYLAGMTAPEISDCFSTDLDLVEQIIAFGVARGYKEAEQATP